MKAVLLAGGLGTRLSEETTIKPKPMVEIGGRPILWHIMKIYAAHGVNEFVVCLGYKGYVIKEYFHNYFLPFLGRDLRSRHQRNGAASRRRRAVVGDPGRDRRGHPDRRAHQARSCPMSSDDEAFCLTYGDGVGDVDISARDRPASPCRAAGDGHRDAAAGPFRRARASKATSVTGFQEKPVGDGGWINGGFFVCSPKVGDYIEDDSTVWEREPLERLASRRPTRRAFPSRLLAADGHVARPPPARRTLGGRQGALEGLVNHPRRLPGCFSPHWGAHENSRHRQPGLYRPGSRPPSAPGLAERQADRPRHRLFRPCPPPTRPSGRSASMTPRSTATCASFPPRCWKASTAWSSSPPFPTIRWARPSPR